MLLSGTSSHVEMIHEQIQPLRTSPDVTSCPVSAVSSLSVMTAGQRGPNTGKGFRLRLMTLEESVGEFYEQRQS